MIGGIALVAAPFVVTSLYIDRYGIPIEGRVYAKAETVRTHYTSWSREAAVTVEYWPPDGSTIAYFDTRLDPADYDTFHKGQRVTVRYLQLRDVPKVPMAGALGKMRMLPVARLAGRSAYSGVQTLLTGTVRRVLQWIVAGIVLLTVWRWAGWPGFKWAVAVCCAVAIAALLFGDFPRPTPAPVANVLQARGHVTAIDHIDRLLAGNRTRGFDAAQSIEVVGVEFVPAGRSDSVLAVDLIDAGSLAALAPKAEVAVDYEAASPRTAHLRGATRTFPARNLRGMAIDSALALGILVGFLALATWLGKLWNRLVKR
ncbi:MAG TPA: hypothetical protein VNV86_00550 [Candidatus Acidoferrum sp.]|nr:hypothetical protein [Candidatus Acidoferrum sp.]